MSVEKKMAQEPCCSKLKVILTYLLLFIYFITLAHYDQRMNESMMHLYSTLLFIAVLPKHFTIMWGGGGGGWAAMIDKG